MELTYADLDFHNAHPGVRFQWDGMGTGCPVCDQFCQAILPEIKRRYKTRKQNGTDPFGVPDGGEIW